MEPQSKSQTLELRNRYIGPSCELFFKSNPLKIVRAEGQYMFDEEGTKYLDCINNVAHVGHCHPDVVSAAAKQMAVLNTNSRFLHDNLVTFAKRLSDTLPSPLSVCYIVNSGSEANDLSIRLARSHTKRCDVAVLDYAYHGNISSLVDMSSYKSSDRADWVHTVPLPDMYRGKYCDSDPMTASTLYAEDVKQILDKAAANKTPIAAFFAESMPSCAGQIVFPPGYLKQVFQHVHHHGGLCVIDEIQTGFGRVGDHMWAFQTQGCDLIPDIVTVGKSIGNGHPLSAVITSKEIAQSFEMEYFNTFGGNPVSAAVGLAVLDVMEKECLQENAKTVGAYLKQSLLTLAEKHPIIGDVRGMGLFMGVELVTDRLTKEPARKEAQHIIARLKDFGIILNSDGYLRNVLKFKPPMCFTTENVDTVCQALDSVFTDMTNRNELGRDIINDNTHLKSENNSVRSLKRKNGFTLSDAKVVAKSQKLL